MSVNLVYITLGAVMGVSLATFTPSLSRRLRSLWTKETSKVKTAVVTEAKAIHTSISTEAADIAKKI